MTRLRNLLEEEAAGAGSLIATTTDGYLVDAAEGRVDLFRFQRRLAEADRAAERADLEAEAKLLADALAEWRGEPLADVPSGCCSARCHLGCWNSGCKHTSGDSTSTCAWVGTQMW